MVCGNINHSETNILSNLLGGKGTTDCGQLTYSRGGTQML